MSLYEYLKKRIEEDSQEFENDLVTEELEEEEDIDLDEYDFSDDEDEYEDEDYEDEDLEEDEDIDLEDYEDEEDDEDEDWDGVEDEEDLDEMAELPLIDPMIMEEVMLMADIIGEEMAEEDEDEDWDDEDDEDYEDIEEAGTASGAFLRKLKRGSSAREREQMLSKGVRKRFDRAKAAFKKYYAPGKGWWKNVPKNERMWAWAGYLLDKWGVKRPTQKIRSTNKKDKGKMRPAIDVALSTVAWWSSRVGQLYKKGRKFLGNKMSGDGAKMLRQRISRTQARMKKAKSPKKRAQLKKQMQKLTVALKRGQKGGKNYDEAARKRNRAVFMRARAIGKSSAARSGMSKGFASDLGRALTRKARAYAGGGGGAKSKKAAAATKERMTQQLKKAVKKAKKVIRKKKRAAGKV